MTWVQDTTILANIEEKPGVPLLPIIGIIGGGLFLFLILIATKEKK